MIIICKFRKIIRKNNFLQRINAQKSDSTLSRNQTGKSLKSATFKKSSIARNEKWDFMNDEKFYKDLINKNPALKGEIEAIFNKLRPIPSKQNSRRNIKQIKTSKSTWRKSKYPKTQLEKEKYEKVKKLLEWKTDFDPSQINYKKYLQRLKKVVSRGSLDSTAFKIDSSKNPNNSEKSIRLLSSEYGQRGNSEIGW